MVNNFEQLQKQTEQLVVDGKYLEALKILKQNVKDPIFNLLQQNVMNKQIANLETFIKQNMKIIELEKASKDELFKHFLNNNYDLVILEKIFDKYKNDLKAQDYAKLQVVLLDDKIPNEIKINFLNILKTFEINHEFDFLNKNFNKIVKINPTSRYDLESSDFLYHLKEDLEAMFFKDVSKSQIASQILNKIYNYYFLFDKEIEYNNDDLLNHITNFVEHSFNSYYVVDKDFLKLVEKIFND